MTELKSAPVIERAALLNELRWKKFPLLSDGFVCLVDVMGDDAAVTQAARVSYGEGTKSVSDDETLLRYLMRHRHCYDEATEVLTDTGFQPWPLICDSDLLGIWDPAKQTLCYEKPEYLTQSHYKGFMYQVQHGGVDLLVTPEHSMWIKRKKWGTDARQMEWEDNYSLCPAVKLANSSTIRYSKLAPFAVADLFDPMRTWSLRCDDPAAFLRFAGFFIGDGSSGSTERNCVSFNLKKERKRVFLREVCVELGWELREGSNWRMSVHAPELGNTFRSLFYDADGDKRIPAPLQMLQQQDAVALLEGLRASDGTSKRSTWEYTTAVKELADSVQLVALHAGEAAHVDRHGDFMYGVMILSRMREPVINQTTVNTGLVNYNGQVYCAKTRTGVLVVRRGGKIVLSGNTTPFEMAELKFMIRCPMDMWRQQIRHRTASVNEYSTRYSEAIDSADTTPPDKWRLQAQTNKQGSQAGELSWPEEYDKARLESDWGTPGKYLSGMERGFLADARQLYEERLKFGVAREQARKDLPLSTYTMAYWKIDLHNLLHFLGLRMEKHAQLEIRSYAEVIGNEIVAKLFPQVWQSFLDFRLNSVSLSAVEQLLLRNLMTVSLSRPPYRSMAFAMACPAKWQALKRCGERDEAWDKFVLLDLVAGDKAELAELFPYAQQ